MIESVDPCARIFFMPAGMREFKEYKKKKTLKEIARHIVDTL